MPRKLERPPTSSLLAAVATTALIAGCADAPQTGPERETWDIIRIDGVRVGHAHARLFRETQHDREVFRVETQQCLTVERFGEKTFVEIRSTSIETPDARLISFETEMALGSAPTRSSGRVEGNRLQLETTTAGKTVRSAIPWEPDYGGLAAIELSLLGEPMQPGDQRTIRSLEPGVNVVATRQLRATRREEVSLVDGSRQLLRIDSLTQLPDGQTFRGTFWTDDQGDVLKSWNEPFNMESLRATKQLALSESDEPALDLGEGVAVEIARRIENPHATRRVRYRVRLQDDDPADVFASGASQRVESTGPHTATITVYALRGDRPGGNPDAPPDEPTDEDRQPNNVIQSDDPKVVELARRAVGDEDDAWRKAQRLESFVHDYMEEVGFSQAFATAAEVARTPVGDCTEHAVLLAAVARAAGLPARTAMGLVYLDRNQAMFYHMWTEVYVDGRWIPVDATLGRGGIGAAHLKVGHGNLEGASAYTSLLPIARVMRKLSVEVEEVVGQDE